MLEWFSGGAQTYLLEGQCYIHLVAEKNQGSENKTELKKKIPINYQNSPKEI